MVLVCPIQAYKTLGICIVCIEVLRPRKQYYGHVRIEPSLPGYQPVLWGVNDLCFAHGHNTMTLGYWLSNPGPHNSYYH